MKKTVYLLLAFLLVATPLTANAQNDITVVVNGNVVCFDVPPFIYEGRTMVPLRTIAEALNAYIMWIEETQNVFYFNNDGVPYSLTIGSNIVEVDRRAGVEPRLVKIDVPPMIVNNRTFIPLRFIAESFNTNVYWHGETSTVYIENAERYRISDEARYHLNSFIDAITLHTDNIYRLAVEQIRGWQLGLNIFGSEQMGREQAVVGQFMDVDVTIGLRRAFGELTLAYQELFLLLELPEVVKLQAEVLLILFNEFFWHTQYPYLPYTLSEFEYIVGTYPEAIRQQTSELIRLINVNSIVREEIRDVYEHVTPQVREDSHVISPRVQSPPILDTLDGVILDDLIGSWSWSGGIAYTFNADGTGYDPNTLGGGNFEWSVNNDMLIISYRSWYSRRRFIIDGDNLTLVSGDGGRSHFTRVR